MEFSSYFSLQTFMKKTYILLSLLAVSFVQAMACTNFIVGRKASADGSVMCTYNADSYGAFFSLYHSPAGKHPKGEMLKIYDWDTNKYHGEIPQAEETYNVIGNINEYQVTFFEATDRKNHYERFEETHLQKAYSIDTVKRLLEEAHFTVEGIYDAFTLNPPTETTERVTFVARETRPKRTE